MALHGNDFISIIQTYLCLITIYDSGRIQTLSTISLSKLTLPSAFSWNVISYADFLGLASSGLCSFAIFWRNEQQCHIA